MINNKRTWRKKMPTVQETENIKIIIIFEAK